MQISPTIIFDHPTLNSVASVLEVVIPEGSVTRRCPGLEPILVLPGKIDHRIALRAWGYKFADSVRSGSELQSLVAREHVTISSVPLA